MSKLIEADLFSDKIREIKELLQKGLGKDAEFAFMTADSVLKLIENQPTAYDVDKVVEQLEKLKSLVPVNRVLDDIVNDKPKELGMLIAYRKAIEIVKGGGVDAD